MPVEEEEYIGYLDGVDGVLDDDIGLTGPDEDDFGFMTLEQVEGFGNLYKYELHYKNQLKATKYAIPVIGKKGDFKAWKGESVENVIKQYENGVAKGGDSETTFTNIDQADKYLKEKHGPLNTQIWHVKKLVDMGPVSSVAPPAQTVDKSIQKAANPTVIKQGKAAVEAGETEQQIMAVEKSLSPTEIAGDLKTVGYITIGLIVVAVVGGVAWVIYKMTPGGQAGSLLGKR